jgi:glycosyltransferase involved in cell wall biosynthesis
MVSPKCALPLISVVVPSYNHGRFLRVNLDSIFCQSYPRLEVVVMDGGSTDSSVEIIESFASRLKFWRSGSDQGQADAVNEGMKHCTGDLVAWLNSDDYYWRDSLWTVAQAYTAYPDYGLYVGNGLRYFQDQGRHAPFNRRHLALNRRALEEGLDYVLQPATFFSRTAWDSVGGLDPCLRYCMDWDLLIRIARTYPAVLINEFLAVSREHPETKTSSGGVERSVEILKMIRRHIPAKMTSGGLYYLLETVIRETGAEPIRHHLHEGMKAIQSRWQDQVGSADGFPEKGDPQDRTYLPFVGGPFAPTRASDCGRLPSVSVVIPSLNQARFLPQALDSLLGQQYPHLETVVIDGGSTDSTRAVLDRYQAQLARYVSEPDRGPADAINKGFALARGEILGWLASDDVLAEGAIWAAARLFAEDPDLDLVYGNALYIDEDNQLFLADHGSYRTGLYYGEMQSPARIPAYWSYVHAVPQPTVFFRRRLLEACGPLNESYQFIFDFELFFRFAQKAKVKKIERTQAFYRMHASAKTASWRHFLIELYRFSRPLWPHWSSSEFKQVLRDFVTNYMNRRNGGGRLRRRLKAAYVAFSAWSGWGNPEAQHVPEPTKPQVCAPPSNSPGGPTPPIDYSNAFYRSSFCSFAWPKHPGFSGGEIRDFHLLRHLLSLSHVKFYSLTPVPRDGRANPLAAYVEAIRTPETNLRLNPHPAKRSLWHRWLGWVQRQGWPVLGPRYHRDGTEFIFRVRAELAPALQTDLDWDEQDFLFVAPQTNPVAMLLEPARQRPRTILASYDVEAIRMARLGAARESWLRRLGGRLEQRRAQRFERDNLAAFDGVIAVSELDKKLFVELYSFPPERVLVIPNGVDPHYFAFQDRPPDGRRIVLFTGNLAYEPNHQAALRLVERIMPLVRRQYPDAVTWIIGKDPAPHLAAKHDDSQVIVSGVVEDVRPYLASAAVSCVPLLAGSGTKYKILEALSAGVPVASSPLGVEGLDLRDKEHLLIGRSDRELADAVSSVLAEPSLSARLAYAGRQQVEQLYSWDAVTAGLGPWLARLAKLPYRREEIHLPLDPLSQQMRGDAAAA